ncbi:hypothetical protein [Microcystis aeruginosa]|nr:hypothetical protein [Microcystis aeruginosa]
MPESLILSFPLTLFKHPLRQRLSDRYQTQGELKGDASICRDTA